MELSLKGSGIAYEPGDVIGLRCPNPIADTAYVLQRLQVKKPRPMLRNSTHRCLVVFGSGLRHPRLLGSTVSIHPILWYNTLADPCALMSLTTCVIIRNSAHSYSMMRQSRLLICIACSTSRTQDALSRRRQNNRTRHFPFFQHSLHSLCPPTHTTYPAVGPLNYHPLSCVRSARRMLSRRGPDQTCPSSTRCALCPARAPWKTRSRPDWTSGLPSAVLCFAHCPSFARTRPRGRGWNSYAPRPAAVS